MRINKITFRNYRNFNDYQICFGAKTTIFIGKNGTGKTNLISGLKQSLSFIFSKKKDERQYKFIASSDRKIESFSATDSYYGLEGNRSQLSMECDYRYPVSIYAEGTILSEKIVKWEFLKESVTSGLKDTLYREANETFWKCYLKKENNQLLPVFAYFSDSYPHIKTNIGKNIQQMLDSGNPPSRNVAYYKWDEEKNCTEIWVQYFTMQWKNHKFNPDEEKKKYLDAIIQKMIQFSEPLSLISQNSDLQLKDLQVEARGKSDVLIMVFANGDRIPFVQLPQGYRRIFSIVFDIANRSYVLNNDCNPSGIVLIDEIELHLHPSVAQEVLDRFKKIFPEIQFIISTHSPLVITNFKQDEHNMLYKLYKEEDTYKNIPVQNLYGVDYNSGLKYSMDTPERESLINELRDAYRYWKEEGDADMMNKLKKKIEEEVGRDSCFYQSLFS